MHQQLRQEQAYDGDQDLMMESLPYVYAKYPQTIFVPVYPRAHVEEVVGIDSERRTVTARFVVYITICLKVTEPGLKQFLKDHLILEFGYNQVIYIPELMKLDNPPFVIQEVIEPDQKQDYVTYKIKGNLECSASFDLMLFPYREIDVVNHLVIRSQVYEDWTIKYNAILLENQGNMSVNQFAQYFINPEFAGYNINAESINIYTDQSLPLMKQKITKDQTFTGYIKNFFCGKKTPETEVDQVDPQKLDIGRLLAHYAVEEDEAKKDQLIDQTQNLPELSPYKHITFNFTMHSLKLAYFLQNEVPIWVLGVVALYLFFAQPDPANRTGNAILVLVSMVAMLTGFRLNNVQHTVLTLYEVKLIIVMVVPMLLIISTMHDFYSNADPNLIDFMVRGNQINNGYFQASIAIYAVCFTATTSFFIYLVIYRNIMDRESAKRVPKNIQSDQLWQNLQEYEWKQPKLFKNLTYLIQQSKGSIQFKGKIKKSQLKKGFEKRLGLTNLRRNNSATISFNSQINHRLNNTNHHA